MKTRIYFLDHLRTFLIFLVVLYHTSLVFQPGFESKWLVSDPVKSNSIGLIGLYGDIFGMFVLFFISGYLMPLSVKKRSAWIVIKSKFKRIMLPWLLAVLTLIPAYKAIFLYSRYLPQEAWYSYFHFFKRTGVDGQVFSNDPTQHWLWFLPILFLFQILYVILSKTKLLSLHLNMKKAIILTLVFGVAYSMLISLIGLRAWTYTAIFDFQNERLPIYFLLFLLGTLVHKLNVFDQYKRNKLFFIKSNIVFSISIALYTMVAMNLFFNIVYPDRHYFFISRHVDIFAYYTLQLLNMFLFLYILLDAFALKLNKPYKFMQKLNQNSYIVYVIHMIVIGLLALPLMPLVWPVYIKFPILVILSFTVSNLIVLSFRKLLRAVK